MNGPPAARLVIIEDGAGLCEFEPPPDGCEQTVVVVQRQGEPPAAFAQRVRRRLCNMQREQQRLVWVTLLLAPRWNAEWEAARIEICRLLNCHAEALPAKSTVLALHAPASTQAAVLKLFDVLLFELGCSALSAHIRFDQPGRGRTSHPVDGSPRSPCATPSGALQGLRVSSM